MARTKNEWATKVFALVKAGNLDAAIAQIKVAPTVPDLARLQAMLPPPTTTPMRQLAKVVEEELALLSAPRLHRAP